MSKWACQVSWEETPHLSREAQAELLASIPPYQKDARTRGIPQLGAGAIYPIAESDILIAPFEIPDWYERCFAMDVGWNKTAGLWGARNPEDDTLYLYAEYYRGLAEPATHVLGFNAKGRWIPGVVDPASRGRGQKDGERLIEVYRDLGMDLLTKADSSGKESALFDVLTRMSTGRLKVFDILVNWLAEFRMYRRDEAGGIVKENDHLMDCMRYLVGSGLKVACQKPIHLVAQGKVKHQAVYEPMAEMFKVG